MTKAKSDSLNQAVQTLKCLSHPVRLSLLCQLHHRGESSVTDLVEHHQDTSSQSQISQFLATMKKEGWVQTRKEGQFVFYSLKSKQIKKLIDALYQIYCR
jgi:ArsR family transcriptional regulator, virulence genes transcriptional regulator